MRNSITANRDVRVFYIGQKRPKVEKTFGTKLRFMPGQSHIMMSTIAEQLLAFRDVFAAEGSPELETFVEANPLDAATFGLVELSDEDTEKLRTTAVFEAEAKAKEEADKKAIESKEDLGMMIPANGGDDAVNEAETAEHLAAMKSEIDGLLTKQLIQDWVLEKNINETLIGTKTDFIAQAYSLYEDKYLDVK